MLKKRRRACASWKNGARCSTARRMAEFCSGISAGIRIRGWRTSAIAPGLEMIRTLQDKGIHTGIDVHMEVHDPRDSEGRQSRVWLLWLSARERSVRRLQDEGDRARDGRHRSLLGDYVELVGVHGRWTCDGDVGWRRSDRHGVYSVSSDRNGVAAERARDADYRGRARRRRRAAQRQGQAVHVRLRAGHVQRGVRGDAKKKRNSGLRRRSAASGRLRGGRRSCSRATWWRGRFVARFAKDAARRTAACFWISLRGGKADEIKKKLPSMYHQFKELADVDITTDPMEVGPTCHYMMGGVRVDAETQESTVPGLYAAGEVGGGMHGANRLGGNSLSDLLVFGKRAGEFAAKKAKETSQGKINQDDVEREAADALRYFGDEQGENPYAIHEELRATMQSLVGIVRTDEDLRAALDKIDELRARSLKAKVGGNIQYNPGWHLALDLKNMLDISEAVTKSALERTESRGGHTREDFPDYDHGMGKAELHRAAE